MINTGPMRLVYQGENGEIYTQPWQDLTEAGTLIDPETGDDLEIIGWTTKGDDRVWR